MSDHTRHDLDELSEYLDGRLSQERSRALEERLRECAECRAARSSLLWGMAQVRRLRDPEGPVDLDAALQAALRREAQAGPAGHRRPWSARRLLPALAAAAVLLIALSYAFRRSGPPGVLSLPEAVADDVRSRAASRLTLAVETSDPQRLEAFLAAERLGFETRVLDLGMMGFALQGGAADPLAGRPSALMVYRETATGYEVLCRMLREGLAALPPPQETREHGGISFQVYRLGTVTIVFWPEGEVLCALAGDGDGEALVQLAFGKAMKAGRPD